MIRDRHSAHRRPDSGCSLARPSMAAAPTIMASTWASNLRHCTPPTYANSLHAVHLLTSHYKARSALHTMLISPAGVSKADRHLAHSCTTSILHHDLSTHVCSATCSHKTLNCLITEICKKVRLTFMPCLSHRSSCWPRALRLQNCIDDPCV
jgi:hypothetical protein